MPFFSEKKNKSKSIPFNNSANVVFDDDHHSNVAKQAQELLNAKINAHSGGYADCDDYFEGCGDSPGLEVWVVDGFSLRALDIDDFGVFHMKNCYIILNTSYADKIGRFYSEIDQDSDDEFKPNLKWSVHYWIGSKSEMDKATIASFKSVELKKKFPFTKVRGPYREEQGEESLEFLGYFGGFITLTEGVGSSESALKKVEKDLRIRLLCISIHSSTHHARVTEVEPSRTNLSPENVMLLEVSSTKTIYQWKGFLSSQMQRAKAFELVFMLRQEKNFQGGGWKVVTIEQGEEPSEFWDNLSTISEIPLYNTIRTDHPFIALAAYDFPSVPDGKHQHSDIDSNHDDLNHSSSELSNLVDDILNEDDLSIDPNYLSVFDSCIFSGLEVIAEEVDAEHVNGSRNYNENRVIHNNNQLSLRINSIEDSDLSDENDLLDEQEPESQQNNQGLTQTEKKIAKLESNYTSHQSCPDFVNEKVEKAFRRYSGPQFENEDTNYELKSVKSMHRSRSGASYRGSNQLADCSQELLDFEFTEPNLFRIGYINGKLNIVRLSGWNSKGEMVGTIQYSMLLSIGVFLLDCFTEVYVWMGKNSNSEVRLAGQKLAEAMMQHFNRPAWVNLTKVIEGSEPFLFKAKFPDWVMSESVQKGNMFTQEKPKYSKSYESLPLLESKQEKIKRKNEDLKETSTSAANDMVAEVEIKKKKNLKNQNENVRTVVKYDTKAKEKNLVAKGIGLLDDPGNGLILVWMIHKNEMIEVPDIEMGHFKNDRSYVCLYGFVPKKPTKSAGRRPSLAESFNMNFDRSDSQSESNRMDQFSTIESFHEFSEKASTIDFERNQSFLGLEVDDISVQSQTIHRRSERKMRRYNNFASQKPVFVILFWQGDFSPKSDYIRWKLSLAKEKLEEWRRELNCEPVEIRVKQREEPMFFFKIFRAMYVVHVSRYNFHQANDNVLTDDTNESDENDDSMSQQVSVSGFSTYTNITTPTEKSDTNQIQRQSAFDRLHTHYSTILMKRQERKKRNERDFHANSAKMSQREKTLNVCRDYVKLFHVKGSGQNEYDIHAIQVRCDGSVFVSSDVFIALRPKPRKHAMVWMWVGQGSSLETQQRAASIAFGLMILEDISPSVVVRVVEEDVNEWKWASRAFWQAIGGKKQYANHKLFRTPLTDRDASERLPRLFLCNNTANNQFKVTALPACTQADFESTNVYILDIHCEVFIWCGRYSDPKTLKFAKLTTQKYVNRTRGNQQRDKLPPIIIVTEGYEPLLFCATFHSWVNWCELRPDFIDPREKRIQTLIQNPEYADLQKLSGKIIEPLPFSSPAQTPAATPRRNKQMMLDISFDKTQGAPLSIRHIQFASGITNSKPNSRLNTPKATPKVTPKSTPRVTPKSFGSNQNGKYQQQYRSFSSSNAIPNRTYFPEFTVTDSQEERRTQKYTPKIFTENSSLNSSYGENEKKKILTPIGSRSNSTSRVQFKKSDQITYEEEEEEEEEQEEHNEEHGNNEQNGVITFGRLRNQVDNRSINSSMFNSVT